MESHARPEVSIRLLPPVLTLVLAATAIPIELRHPAFSSLNFSVFPLDFVANIVGYVPVGLVLAELGPFRGILLAALLSIGAEATQFAMMHRDPSVIDVIANIAGAVLGVLVNRRWRIRSPQLTLDRFTAAIAAVAAVTLTFGVWMTSGYAPSPRGDKTPGTLEAHWTFDEHQGRVVIDSAGHGLDGKFRGGPKRMAGVLGGALALNGSDYLEVGASSTLRLVGSMTISAWIYPTSFPPDDAAIISSHNGQGFQLDTTIDKGPRTIGFKLANVCGELMMRYGATALVVDEWYHIAGVYDADARTMDVYLNGNLDNGPLVGSVTSRQRPSREAVFVGRRSDSRRFNFSGAVDDVQIYSRALTKTEILEVMKGASFAQDEGRVDGQARDLRLARREPNQPPCAVISDQDDARLPGAAAMLGALVAIAWFGFRPASGLLPALGISLLAGVLVVPVTASTLPSWNHWALPLTCLAGGLSVTFARRRKSQAPFLPSIRSSESDV
jgi:concanavalin A-like lectin/glucanase superfamily protein/VanZ like protein